jgi:hypothetical protein
MVLDLTAVLRLNGFCVSTHWGRGGAVSGVVGTKIGKPHLLKMTVNVLGQLAEEHPEERSEERTRQIESLGSKVISVVEIPPLQRREQETMDHVPEEVGLLSVLALRHRDVGKHLLLEDLLGVVDSALLRQSRDRSSTTDEVESDLLEFVSDCSSTLYTCGYSPLGVEWGRRPRDKA